MPPEKKKIIIIGAGIAGLGAANYLKKNGYDPIILEAQNGVGGRIKTNRSAGIAFDEGASWIHGPTDNPISELAEQAGAETFLTEDKSMKVYDVDGVAYPQKRLLLEEAKYDTIVYDFKGKKKQSFATAFYEQHPEYKAQRLWTYMLSAFLEFDTGGDIHRLGSKGFYDDEDFAGKDVIITNGYDTITEFLAKDIDIRLNTAVAGINYEADEIKIATNQGAYLADVVLVTVPLGVLQRGVITFEPQLARKTQQAIAGLEMGTVNKFMLIWDEIFWEKDLQYIGYTPEEKGKFNYFLNVSKFSEVAGLITFALGDYAKETETMADADIIESIMAHLRKIYGAEIPNPREMIRTRWKENPFSFGSYAFAPTGRGSRNFRRFEKPIDRKIFFAGEHTIRDYRATVHGAYLSGIREAKKMLRELN